MIFFDFDWDAKKARANLKKHAVSFRFATGVFNDPLAMTVFDEAHSDDEERWVTIGRVPNSTVLVVVHTTAQVSNAELHIRIISARRADREETREYEQTSR